MLGKGLAGDFIGEIGAFVEAHEGGIDIGQVTFDGIEVEWALMLVHKLSVGDRALVSSMQ